MNYLPLLLLLISCGEDINSNSSDKERFGRLELENDPQLREAYTVIQNRCVNCHTSNVHASWASLTTNQQWKDSGLVNSGSPQSSELVQRIINTGTNDSNMPLGAGPLPDDEYDAIVNWVQALP